jgi:Type II CAAX prenyl endopeptidase Rce1-like
MFLSRPFGRLVSILILFRVCDKSYAISFAKGASRPRLTETSSAAQLYYRNSLHPEDEISTAVSSISHVIAVAPVETPLSLTPIQIATSGPMTPDFVSGVDVNRVASLLNSQICVLLLSSIGFGVVSVIISNNGSIYADHSLWSLITNDLTRKIWNPMDLVYCIGSATPLILVHHCNINEKLAFAADQNGSNASSDTILYGNQMEMTHLTMKLFGRRRSIFPMDQPSLTYCTTPTAVQVAFHRTRMSQTPTASCLALSVVIAGTIALTSEVVYRLSLPLLFGHFLDNSLALFISAIMYGFSRIYWNHSPTHSIPKLQGTFMIQTLESLWYSYLLTSTGSLFFPIIAHCVYDMDTLTTNWHRVNDQIDYVDQKLQRSGKETTAAALPNLTAEAVQVSQRIFHAFDSQHKSSLNEADVYKMVQYMYNYKQEMRPSSVIISEEFQRFARRDNHVFKDAPPRLKYKAFLEFLKQLHRYEKLKQSEMMKAM